MKIANHTEAIDYYDQFIGRMKDEVEEVVAARFKRSPKPMAEADLRAMIRKAVEEWFR